MKIFLVLALCIFGCSGSPKVSKQEGTPQWIDNPQVEYPKSEYVVVVGVGDNYDDAQKSAFSKISSIFKTEVSVSGKVIDEYKQVLSSFSQDVEVEKSLSKNEITTKSQETLLNVRFGKSFSANDGRVYVIAYLDRDETATIYRQKINSNKRAIEFYLDEKSDELILQFAFLKAAYTISKVNQMLTSQLQIISSSSKIPEATSNSHSQIAISMER